jgi:hypothetical protein
MGSTSPAGPGVVRLLQEEPTPAERYAHAAALLAIVKRLEQPTIVKPAGASPFLRALSVNRGV